MGERNVEQAQALYAAFAAGDRAAAEALLARLHVLGSARSLPATGTGSSCGAGRARAHGQRFDFVRLIPSGDEVVVTYERTRPDGGRGRNTEVLSFDGEGRILRAEVYFGWEL